MRFAVGYSPKRVPFINICNSAMGRPESDPIQAHETDNIVIQTYYLSSVRWDEALEEC